MPLHLDLFSGIGGFSLASGWANYTTIGFCEVDPFCRRVLAKHWPGVPIHGDIRTLTGEIVSGWAGGRPVDLITGGFPCQPVSVAGKRMGKEDDRYLWPEMLRVIAGIRPHRVLGENVAGIVTMGLDAVLSDLESLGYTCRPVVIPAAAVGAPTAGIASGFSQSMWPTPTAVDRPNEGNVRILRGMVLDGSMSEQEATAILGKSPFEPQGKIPGFWPTRTWRAAESMRTDAAQGALPETFGEKAHLGLDQAVRMWPTPRASENENGRRNQRRRSWRARMARVSRRK
jgi:hypothetical protein